MRYSQSPFRLVVRGLAAAGIGLALGACAAIEQAAINEAKSEVTERVQQRWDHVTKGQTDKAYQFLSPASRSTLSFEAFRKRHAAGRWWRSMAIEKVDCRADTCQVTMAVEYDLYEIKGLKRTIEETWIKEAGTWWLVAAQ